MGTVKATDIVTTAGNLGVHPKQLPGGLQEFTFHPVRGRSFTLKHSAASAIPPRPFLLAHHTLNVRALKKLLAACSHAMISVGFDMTHAQVHELVYVVGNFDPQELVNDLLVNETAVTCIAAQDFKPLSNAEKNNMTQAGILVAEIAGDLDGRTLTQCLKDIFAGRPNQNVTHFS